MVDFSAVGITDQCPRAIATGYRTAGCRATSPPLGLVGETLIGLRLSACISCRIQVHSKHAGYGFGDITSTRVGVVMLGIRVIVVIRI